MISDKSKTINEASTKLEELRIQELKSYNILDSEPEKEFQELVNLAAQICKCSMAMIGFLDEQRLWIKAKVGLDLNEIPRHFAFCSYTIMSEGVFIIHDALKDERFQMNPFVRNIPNIRFYAGIPLRTASGHVIGTLCILDQKPQDVGSFEITGLEKLGHQVNFLLENRRSMSLLKKVVREQESKLVSASRLVSIGEMSAEVIHEINNPLYIIMGKANQLAEELIESSFDKGQISDELHKIEKAAVRIDKIVRGLKNLVRHEEEEEIFVEFSLENILKESLELCHSLRSKENVDIRLSGILEYKMKGNPVQISQVFINLLNNAFYAIRPLRERWVEIKVERIEEAKVRISFTDSGSGIPAEIADKIMSAYYTTKANGEGTGLGLSISSAIIANHGGVLFLDRKNPHTCFCIDLPIPGVP